MSFTLISDVVTVVHGIQLVVATFQNETKLAQSARLLMHSCHLYEEAVNTIQVSIQEKLNNPAYSNRESAKLELDSSIKRIEEQIALDKDLLKSILKEVESIKESKAKGGILRNVFTSVATGRVDAVKHYSNQLLERFQVLSAFMLKDIWKSANALDPVLMEQIADTEGAMFWYGQFANDRQVTFGVFMDAYQSYCSSLFKCRTFQRRHLMTLLRHSLLEVDIPNDGTLLVSEVSVNQFAQWLRRYGPMKDTLSKAAVVSNPDLGSTAPWFYKAMPRDLAVNQITANIAKFSGGIQPHQMFVVRFSSDVKNPFVVTCHPPRSAAVEHFPITNGPLGYSVVGETKVFSATLVECVQTQILDKLFSKALNTEIILNRSNVDDWELIVAALQVDLPSDHYKDVEALNAATEGLDLGPGSAGTGKSNATFGNLLGRQEARKAAISAARNTIANNSASAAAAPAASSLGGSSSGASRGDLSAGEQGVVGRYMVNQGLALLVQSGQMGEAQAEQIRRMM